MATAITPRNDMYLSVLAGRAVTALADLAGDSSAWNDRIENGLRDGIRYCQAVRGRGSRILEASPTEVPNPLKRSVEKPADKRLSSDGVYTESKKVERFLSQVFSRKHTPQIAELVAAIEFLRKTARDR